MIYAVDLDGTLAEYGEFKGESKIGKPITKMKTRVMNWIKKGDTVIIFTARARNEKNIGYVKDWLKENGFPDLEVTNVKYPKFDVIYDDKAIQVKKNTGELVGPTKETE